MSSSPARTFLRQLHNYAKYTQTGGDTPKSQRGLMSDLDDLNSADGDIEMPQEPHELLENLYGITADDEEMADALELATRRLAHPSRSSASPRCPPRRWPSGASSDLSHREADGPSMSTTIFAHTAAFGLLEAHLDRGLHVRAGIG